MSKERDNPVLRFTNDNGYSFPDWKTLKLGDVAKCKKGKNKDESITRVLTNSAVHGVVDQRDYFHKDIAVKGNLEGYYIVDEGDYVYNPRVSTTAPVGPISKNKLGKGVMSPLYTVFRFNSENNDFYEQFFKSSNWHQYLRAVSNTGARHDRMSISAPDFISMPVPSADEKEQKKITDCLSSIDELVIAHNQKLEALKSHRKSLMQQLFPAEGETAPKLRFPEFKGDWEEFIISDLAKVGTGNKDTQDKVENGDFPFFVRSQTIERINSFSFDGEAILTSGDGVGVGKNYHYFNGKFDFHQRVYCIYDFEKRVLGKFIYLYFSEHFYNRVMKLSAKNSVDSVRRAMITEMPIRLPRIEEQQKITDCLFSVDDLITAQSQKLESLKTHKKGLLQQLFPSTDKVGL
jgi:type I restriction enzyme, S subunit